MSTFNGKFEEICGISADCFNGNNLKNKVFFLSHCHEDHMRGLGEAELPGPLFTSPVSAVFIKQHFPNIKDVRILDIECATEISYEYEGRNYKVVVTTISARHCPGSVMFLFETLEITVLYTGDFRLTRQDLEKFPSLKEKTIDVVYLDSTFLDKRYPEFPSQLESINAIYSLCKEWIERGKDHKIILQVPAKYGYEFLYEQLGEKLQCMIYVDTIKPRQFDKYIYIPSMDRCISQVFDKCQIYIALMWCTLQELRKISGIKMRVIKPSALYWKFWKKGSPIILELKSIYRVAYSNHSSLTEIKEFLDFIRPKVVKLNVIPKTDNAREEMNAVFREIFKGDVIEDQEPSVEVNFKNIYSEPSQDYYSDDESSCKILLPKRVKL